MYFQIDEENELVHKTLNIIKDAKIRKRGKPIKQPERPLFNVPMKKRSSSHHVVDDVFKNNTL